MGSSASGGGPLPASGRLASATPRSSSAVPATVSRRPPTRRAPPVLTRGSVAVARSAGEDRAGPPGLGRDPRQLAAGRDPAGHQVGVVVAPARLRRAPVAAAPAAVRL